MEAKIQHQKRQTCPAEIALKMISGRWKLLIWGELFAGAKRFGELQRVLGSVTQKMLTQQLREMEEDGIVHREVYLQIPPKVEYSLTPLGKELQAAIAAMHAWGDGLMEREIEK
jgi:DNA-binding HxlR family transcriptional regulator